MVGAALLGVIRSGVWAGSDGAWLVLGTGRCAGALGVVVGKCHRSSGGRMGGGGALKRECA